ncbi:Ig-like domain-containing protein [Autumnicola psychrophila]|uniref:Ig-like domain-containing protein n=1 Tax=Autumnicola psychrophila TaxID=3075592 RepID=A0ABU3DUD0_9FLAO|nr:Ig-like domain-containing protein [Zunongwangia sp. F225]MDT0687253.1 Ig-like domain-containing protein [Zunongwangia sp. F225]
MISSSFYPTKKILTGISPLGLFVLIFFFFFVPQDVVGQDPADVVPEYMWDAVVGLPPVGLSNLNPDNLTIAVATDSQDNVYTLSFGSGVDKRNADGQIGENNFIDPSYLESPLDIAIDDEGFLYIADYSDNDSNFSRHGKIRVFDPEGNPDRIIYIGFYRPMGIDVDSENIYIAEYYDGEQGPDQGSEFSRISVYDKQTENRDEVNSVDVKVPYRIAVNSQGKIFVSQAGDDDPAVLIFNGNLNYEGRLGNVQSPGSLIFDDFDYLHVVEYAGEINFGELLDFSNTGLTEAIEFSHQVYHGIEDNAFGIKIFDPNQSLVDFYQEKIEFPIDIAFNNCDKMYLLNSNVIPLLHIDNFFGHRFIPNSLESDLEIYERTPSFDSFEGPVITTCPENITVTAQSGTAFAEVEFNDPEATDNCEAEVEQTGGYPSGTEFPVGTHTIEFTATDNFGLTDICTFTITVEPSEEDENTAPLANNDDGYSTNQDEALTIPAPGVLGNDTDTEGDDLTAAIATQPENGTVILNPDGSFTYTPDSGFFGEDTFTYVANDGNLDSNEATVIITVNEITPPNTAPLANIDDEYSTNQDEALTIPAPGVLGNDTDPEGDELTAAIATQPENGTVTLNSDGSFIYTPDSGYFGEDTFTYVANDGNLDSNEATVTITVNEVTPPNTAPFANDDEYDTNQDESLTIPAPGVLGNDSDPEGDELTAAIATQPENGTITLNSDGSFIYTPDSGYFGEDTFTYIANDGNLDSNEATVTITVNEVTPPNTAPLANNDDEYSTNQDESLTIPAPGVLGNDSDPEGDELTAAIATQPENGTVTLNSDGSFTYTPDSGFFGEDTFTYVANDGNLDSNEATVTITVNEITPPNTAPLANNDDEYSTNQDEALTIPAPGVLGNDSDPEGDELTAAIATQPENGTVTLNSDGSFIYTPDSGYFGEDTFTYVANDGNLDSNEATVTITVNEVTPPNTAPFANDDEYDTNQDESLTIPAPGVLGNDSDPEGDELTAAIATQPENGTITLNSDGSFIYTPDSGYFGEDTFTYIANDGELVSDPATVMITVIAPPEPNCIDQTVYLDDNGQAQLTAEEVYGSDPDLDNVRLNLSQRSFNCSDVGNTVSVTLRVIDNQTGLSSECIAEITVEDNKPPQRINCAENRRIFTVDFGESGRNVIYEAPEFTDNCDEDLTIDIEGPEVGEFFPLGETVVTYTATDEFGNFSSCSFIIEVQPNADLEAPVFTNCPEENITVTTATGQCDVAAPFEMPEATDNSGEVSVEPTSDLGFEDRFPVGEHRVTYRATDEAGNFVECDIRVIVTEDVAPQITCPGPKTANFDPEVGFTVLDYRSEVAVSDACTDEEELRQNLVQDPAPGEVIYGNQQISFTVEDASGNLEECSFTLTLNEVTDEVAPTFVDCPSANGMTQEAAPGLCEAVVHFPVPEATDSEGNPVAVQLMSDLGPGDNFPFGPTEVAFTATGENGLTATCTFTVTIIDNEIPEIETCPDPKTANFDPEVGFIVTDYRAEVAVSDNCTSEEDLIIIQTPAPGEIIYASQDISFTVEDVSGNDNSCSFQLTLEEEAITDRLVARDDEYFVEDNSQLFYVSEQNGILVNDSFNQANLPQIEIISPPQGAVDRDPDGSFTYSPLDNFTGEDSFTYRLNDGENVSEIATVTINVSATTPSLDINCPIDQVEAFDENCQFLLPDYRSLAEVNLTTAEIAQSPAPGTMIYETQQIQLTATAGEETQICYFQVVMQDQTAPFLACPEEIYEQQNADGTFILPDYAEEIMITDNCGLATVVQDPAPGTSVSAGDEVEITLTATDNSANSTTCSFPLILTSEEVVEISCPEDQTEALLENCSFQVPDYTAMATVSNPNAVVTQSPQEGEMVSEDTVVTLTATLNGMSDECSFNLFLEDNVTPVANCVDGYLLSLTDGMASLTAEELDFNSNDNCGIVEMSIDQNIFTTEDLGDNMVTLTVTDAAGNSSTCETIVTVIGEDDGPVSCVNGVTLELDVNGEAYLNIDDVYTGNPSGELSVSRTYFTCEDVGVNRERFYYTENGEETFCEFSVTVAENFKPQVTVNNIGIDINQNGIAVLTEEDLQSIVTATDNCSNELRYEVSQDEFNCSHKGANLVNLTVTDESDNATTTSFTVFVNTPLGTCGTPLDEDDYVFVYPNPNNGSFKINTPSNVVITNIRAYDMRGRFIGHINYDETVTEYAMSLGEVETAVYVLRLMILRNGREEELIRRVIVRNL